MAITKLELQQILRNNHIDISDNYALNQLYNDFFNPFFSRRFCNYSYAEVYSLISGIKKQSIWELSDNSYVNMKIQDITQKINSGVDVELFKQISLIDSTFKDRYRLLDDKSKRGIDACIKEIWNKVKDVNHATNKGIEAFTKTNLDAMLNLALLYKSLSEHIPAQAYEDKQVLVDDLGNKHTVITNYNRVADYVMLKKLMESDTAIKSLLKNLSAEQIREFNELATRMESQDITYSDDEVFSEEEFLQLILKTKSIITIATKEKYYAVISVMREYMDSIAEMPGVSVEDKKLWQEKTVKSIIKHCGTIIGQTPKTFKENADLFMGKDMKTVIKSIDKDAKGKIENERRMMRELFPNMRLQGMTAQHQMNLVEGHMSIFNSISIRGMYDITCSMIDMVYAGINPNGTSKNIVEKRDYLVSRGFDVEDIIHADNIYELGDIITALRSDDDVDFSNTQRVSKRNKIRSTMVANIAYLTKMLTPNDVQQIVTHNLNIIRIDNAKLVDAIETIKSTSKSTEELNDKLNEFFNQDIKVKGKDASSEGLTEAKTRKSSIIERPAKAQIVVVIEGDVNSIETRFKSLTNMMTTFVVEADKYSVPVVNKKVKAIINEYNEIKSMVGFTENMRQEIVALFGEINKVVQEISLIKNLEIEEFDSHTTDYYVADHKRKKMDTQCFDKELQHYKAVNPLIKAMLPKDFEKQIAAKRDEVLQGNKHFAELRKQVMGTPTEMGLEAKSQIAKLERNDIARIERLLNKVDLGEQEKAEIEQPEIDDGIDKQIKKIDRLIAKLFNSKDVRSTLEGGLVSMCTMISKWPNDKILEYLASEQAQVRVELNEEINREVAKLLNLPSYSDEDVLRVLDAVDKKLNGDIASEFAQKMLQFKRKCLDTESHSSFAVKRRAELLDFLKEKTMLETKINLLQDVFENNLTL